MPTAPTLTDGVVTLRAHRAGDAQGSWEQCQDPVSQRWTTVPVPYAMSDAEAFVRELMPGGWADGSEWGFAVEVEGRYAGTVSLRPEGDARAELAYGSHPWVRGTGHMERAVRVLLEWGFAAQGIETVIWWSNRGNWASRKLAWRLGFTFEGTVRSWLPQRGRRHDAWVATLLRDDPREPRTSWLACPVIEGAGIRLRPWRDDDAPRIVEACADERTSYWLGRLPVPYTPADAEAYLQDRVEVLATGRAVGWAVADGATDQLVGSVALFDLEVGRQAELGYWAHPSARGRGVMTTAARLALEHGFGPLALRRVTAFAATGNTASRHVIESCGFRLVGVERQAVRVRTGLVDHAAYDLLAEDLTPRVWTSAEAMTTRKPATDRATPTRAVER